MQQSIGKTMIQLSVVGAMAAMASVANAQAVENRTTECTHGSKTRTITLHYATPEALPCEIQYTKDGVMKVLWSATNKAGFCVKQYQDFVAKQQGWGWQCTEVAPSAKAEEAETSEPEPAAAAARAEADLQ
ncbi:MAG: hypothetical protein HWE13_01425 [Gammaproteobacteria bacterium]|nr:hypothetical protein [Gammaproteobacteria bacterium]NVK86750.1 hypothetical protein [Gammaproteobacteria bacterium]